jgi:hypothetical protein
LNSLGDTLWTRTLGERWADEHFNAVRQTSDGGFIAAGYWQPQDIYKWLVRLDENGDTLWTRHLDRGSAQAVTVTEDGGYVVGGLGPIGSGYYLGMRIQKVSSAGDSLWARTYGSRSYDWQAYDAQQTADGGFMLVGLEYPTSTAVIGILKTDAEGDSLWSMTFSTTHGQANSVARTASGAYVVAGTALTQTQSGQIWLAKIGYEQIPSMAPSFIASPASFGLSAYPNPFNPATEITFSLPTAGPVTVKVFDILGQQISVLQNGLLTAGQHRVTFDGAHLPAGIYFLRLEAASHLTTLKLVLLK